MSTFNTEIVSIEVRPHPNADRLEIARVGDFQSIVLKGQFQTGDRVAYIQEGSVVPEVVLAELGLVGKLAGPDRDRVRAMKLRGVLSQGICYPARPEWQEGQDVSEQLGITQYVPEVPSHMSGEVYAGRTVKYDIEPLKRYPQVLQQGEPVRVTEKIHGTFCCIGVLAAPDPVHGRLAVSSKGLGNKGLVFAPDADANTYNLYLQVARALDAVARFGREQEDVFVVGEVYGPGVQDMHYGRDEAGFRVFDVRIGERWLDHEEIMAFCEDHDVEHVPVLYTGPYDRQIIDELTTGEESVSGERAHFREGVVVRPLHERDDPTLGRVQLKAVSERYLLRKGGTEFQ